MADREAEALAVLDQHAVGAGLKTGLGQQRLGPVGIVRVRLDAGVVGPARRRELAVGHRGVTLQDFLHDAGHVDRVIQRAPHAHVVERRQVLAPTQIRVGRVVGEQHLEPGRLLEPRDFGQRRVFHEVHTAGAQLLEQDHAVGDDAEDQPVQSRSAAVVLLVGFHDDAIAAPPLDELEGPGPHRLAVELGRVQIRALEQMLGHDAGARVDEDRQERARRIAQPKAHGVIVDHLDRSYGQILGALGILLGRQLGKPDQRVEVRAVRRGHLRIEDRVERERDVARRERLAVVPRHPFLQLERIGEAVLRRLPRLRQQRAHVELLVQLDEAVEHGPLDGVGHAVGGDHRVERRGVAAEADDEVLAGGPALARA